MTPICINFSSFLDESICSIPDLEELPNSDLAEIPSFLGQNYQPGDCGRVLRSHKKSMSADMSAYHPMSICHNNLSKDHPLIPFSSIN